MTVQQIMFKIQDCEKTLEELQNLPVYNDDKDYCSFTRFIISENSVQQFKNYVLNEIRQLKELEVEV